ncbi:31k virion structural protein [Carcinus maenas nudivirus]|uniref:31k virion structural protein n=1 Tax=Carcinus maenas nudivirus TaxID=2880837 RepID=A0AAE9BZY3_9VIRU|nr:31k virion structural protein [Carcinus maenas nudivirus]UBZ25605.1 31k virion structural protein [Carcinus maenas nudivirus]
MMFNITPTNNCMFQGIKACSKEPINFTHVACSKHSRDCFHLSSKKMKLFSNVMHNKMVMHTTVENACLQEYDLLPFPIAFKPSLNAGSPYEYNGQKLCINQTVMTDCITHFINEKNLSSKNYTAAQIQQVINALITYISDGSYQALNAFDNGAIQNYNTFLSQNQNRMKSYWKPLSKVSVVLENNTIIQFPISAFPLFYQAMFVGFEISEHMFRQNQPAKYLIPNCILNCNKKMICTFNQSEDNLIYKDVPGVDYASPLILVGSVTHDSTTPYNQFEKPQAYPAGIYTTNSRPTNC